MEFPFSSIKQRRIPAFKSLILEPYKLLVHKLTLNKDLDPSSFRDDEMFSADVFVYTFTSEAGKRCEGLAYLRKSVTYHRLMNKIISSL